MRRLAETHVCLACATPSHGERRSDMATASQADFFTTAPDWATVAAKRFPLSARASLIRGSGPFVVVSKCFHRWRVYCYTDPTKRDLKLQEWENKGCTAGIDCKFDHVAVDLIL